MVPERTTGLPVPFTCRPGYFCYWYRRSLRSLRGSFAIKSFNSYWLLIYNCLMSLGWFCKQKFNVREQEVHSALLSGDPHDQLGIAYHLIVDNKRIADEAAKAELMRGRRCKAPANNYLSDESNRFMSEFVMLQNFILRAVRRPLLSVPETWAPHLRWDLIRSELLVRRLHMTLIWPLFDLYFTFIFVFLSRVPWKNCQ